MYRYLMTTEVMYFNQLLVSLCNKQSRLLILALKKKLIQRFFKKTIQLHIKSIFMTCIKIIKNVLVKKKQTETLSHPCGKNIN